MRTLTHDQLTELLKSGGAMPVGISAITDARLKKTGNPFPQKTAFKKIKAVGFAGANYEKSVNGQLSRHGMKEEFQADSLPWGEWVIPNKVIAHKGKLYLRLQTTSGQRKRQPAKLLGFFDVNGKPIPKEEVKPFLPKVVESEKQAEVGLGHISEQVFVRTYAMDSIVRIRCKGETFALSNK